MWQVVGLGAGRCTGVRELEAKAGGEGCAMVDRNLSECEANRVHVNS